MARSEAIRWAKRIGELNEAVAGNTNQITGLAQVSEAAHLLEVKDFGAGTASTSLTVSLHQGWVHSESAFASLAGTNPIPASSGNTVHHRLNRGGT